MAKAFMRYVLKLTYNYLCGTLDFNFYYKIRAKCDCCVKFQYSFEILRYIVYMLSVFVVGIIYYVEYETVAVLLFFLFLFPFGFQLFILVHQFRKARKVKAVISEILNINPDRDDSLAKEVVLMTTEDEFGSEMCSAQNPKSCRLLDVQHRMRCHSSKTRVKSELESKAEPFTIKIEDGSPNYIIGFHQTTIDVAKLIVHDCFRPGSAGLLGAGIYFAICKESTEFKKRRDVPGGAYFVAKIEMKHTQQLKRRPENHVKRRISPGFDSLYLNHEDGPFKDEFIVTKAEQILEYAVVFTKKDIKDYKRRANSNV
jgi:hypothetical protein